MDDPPDTFSVKFGCLEANPEGGRTDRSGREPLKKTARIMLMALSSWILAALCAWIVSAWA